MSKVLHAELVFGLFLALLVVLRYRCCPRDAGLVVLEATYATAWLLLVRHPALLLSKVLHAELFRLVVLLSDRCSARDAELLVLQLVVLEANAMWPLVALLAPLGQECQAVALLTCPSLALLTLSFVLQEIEPRKVFTWCNPKYPTAGIKIQGSDRSLRPDRWSLLRCVDFVELPDDANKQIPYKVNTLRVLVLSHDAASTIAMSQYNLSSSVAKALKEGVDYYISGPIDEYKICSGSLYLEFYCRKGDDKRLEAFAKGAGATLKMKKLQVTVAVFPPHCPTL